MSNLIFLPCSNYEQKRAHIMTIETGETFEGNVIRFRSSV